MTTCTQCGEEKALSEFSPNAQRRNGVQTACKTCRRIAARRKRGVFEPDGETGARCAVCRSTRGLCLDHDHGTGVARDTLCRRCNMVIGNADDDPDLLRRLARYLELHACN